MQTNMDVIARWIRAIALGKGRHFLTPWHRFKNQRKEAGKRRNQSKEERRREEEKKT
jgi:hypothetical protein